MSSDQKFRRARERAERLQAQANNCVSVAVQDPTHRAEFIDEAIRLAQRSRELRGD